MKEEKRISVVNLINNIKQQQEEYLALEKRLTELKYYPEVREYIHTKNRINALGHNKSLVNYNHLNHFRAAIFGEACEHPIYMYIGHYKEKQSCWNCDQPVLNENDSEYTHNLYKCLECENKIMISKECCQEFEKNNVVIIISQNDHSVNNAEFRTYNDYYYQLLLENTTEEAVNKIKKLIKTK